MELPAPDPSTRRLTPWPRRAAWSSATWIVFAVVALVVFMLLRAVL